MFLHVICAGVFEDNLRAMFEAAVPGESRFVSYVRDSAAFDRGVGAPVGSVAEVLSIVRESGPWEGLTVNGLNALEMSELSKGLPDRVPCAWYVWGYEAYGLAPCLRRRLFGPLTRRLLAAREPSLRSRLRRLRDQWRQDLHASLEPPFDRFDFCVTRLPEEYALFKRHRLFVHTAYRFGGVGAIEDYVDVAAPIEELGPDIQVGHSAAATLNHLETFALLKRMGVGDRTVVVPLGYGDPTYRDEIVQHGSHMLADRFMPLLEFMPLGEYNAFLQRCGILIMNQMRQQGMGTVVAALWRGALVYMNDTPLYRALRRTGIDVRLIRRDLARDARHGFIPLSREQIQHHRDRLIAVHGRAAMIAATRALLADMSAMAHGRR